jgi:hypothetical protein
VTQTSTLFPPGLKNKIPPMLLIFVEQRAFGLLLGFALYVFSLNGPFVGKPDHNGYRYLIGPFVCALVAAGVFIIRPFNPYRGTAARLGGMESAGESGSAAERLVELFRSSQARRFVWQTAAKISGVCFLLMAIVTWTDRSSLEWTIRSQWAVPGILGGCIGSYIAIGSEYVGWVLKTWAKREDHAHGVT